MKHWPARTGPLDGLAGGQSPSEPLEGGTAPQDSGDSGSTRGAGRGAERGAADLPAACGLVSPPLSPPHAPTWWAEPWGGNPRATWLLSLTSSGAVGNPFNPSVSTPIATATPHSLCGSIAGLNSSNNVTVATVTTRSTVRPGRPRCFGTVLSYSPPNRPARLRGRDGDIHHPLVLSVLPLAGVHSAPSFTPRPTTTATVMFPTGQTRKQRGTLTHPSFRSPAGVPRPLPTRSGHRVLVGVTGPFVRQDAPCAQVAVSTQVTWCHWYPGGRQ